MGNFSKHALPKGLSSRWVPDLGMDWGVSSREFLMDAMLSVSLLRRSPECAETWASELARQPPGFEVELKLARAQDAFEAHDPLTFGEVVRLCRLNYEVSDPTTRAHQQIMQNATDGNRSLWSFFLVSVLKSHAGRAHCG